MELLLVFLAGAGVAAFLILVVYDRRVGVDDEPMLAEMRGALDRLSTSQGSSAAELKGMLTGFSDAQQHLLQQTTQLSRALARPGVRGQWGESALKRVFEMAGLGEHTDFLTQVHVAADEDHDEAVRPDAVVQLPGGGAIPIDAKVPLDAFMDALAAEAPAAQAEALNRHVELVRGKVRELSAKAYWRRFDRSPEMVVMFVASEAAFAAAMERYPRLLDEAAQARVVVTTPMTMLGLLQVVALGWREAALSENAEQVRTLAQTLVSRLGVMSRHLSEVGKGLERAARAHNDAVGSYESRLLTTARQFTRLGVEADGLKEPARANTSIRQLVGEPEQPIPLAETSQPAEVVNGADGPHHPQASPLSEEHGQSLHPRADAEGPQQAEQTLWCQPGAHDWQRPAQRGRPPTSCSVHAPERVARPAPANVR